MIHLSCRAKGVRGNVLPFFFSYICDDMVRIRAREDVDMNGSIIIHANSVTVRAYIRKDITLPPFNVVEIDTGLSVALGKGFVYRVRVVREYGAKGIRLAGDEYVTYDSGERDIVIPVVNVNTMLVRLNKGELIAEVDIMADNRDELCIHVGKVNRSINGKYNRQEEREYS